MSGCKQQRWVTCAGDDEEAWRCILLARSLKRTLTTRPLGIVIDDDKVTMPLRRKLQEEAEQCFWVDPNEYPGLSFRSVAKTYIENTPNFHKSIFVDCNCLFIKNCDHLFQQSGVQFVKSEDGSEFVSVMVFPRSMGKDERRSCLGLILRRENPGNIDVDSNDCVELEGFHPALEMSMQRPTPLSGNDVKLICFTSGHPLSQETQSFLNKRGLLEEEVKILCVSLCPELHPSNEGIKFQPEFDWELNNSIAIVGMACRYPCANTMDEFWHLLENGLEGIRKVPEGRWTKDNAFIRMDNLKNTEAGFLSCPIDTFDAKFFNTSAADMHYLDPQQRLSLRVVWEALEHAGIDAHSLKNSLSGVFGGWWRNDYKEMLQMLGFVDTDFLRGYMGNALGPLTARIAHFFELIGPAFSTESGCSTSIAGVDMACDSLRNDTCNLAICVGANLLLHPFSPALMEGVLAPDGRCKTFDASADGFGRAEGIGVLILKRFGDAVANGDRIWGVIRGCAVVQEGPSKSMGTPTVDVEARAMELALERSGVDPNDVEFVETHGTGTPVGDPIEVAAIARAYARSKDNILTIASVKTNIGHTESVCGITGIQKAVLAFKHEMIPPHLHLNKVNPDIDLASIPAQIPTEAIPWKRRPGGKPRIAGVNSFGITGAQAHVIVQETPGDLPTHQLSFHDNRKKRMLTFSAKSEDALKAQLQAYYDFITGANDKKLRDVEYSMNTGRPHFVLRHVITGSSIEELQAEMKDAMSNKGTHAPLHPQKVCFLFTGQGSQYPGMAKTLYEENIVFRSTFDWCEALLEEEHGFTLKQALWTEEKNHLLKTSLFSQTSIFVIEYCLLKLWESWGVKPDAVLGHSLGEFGAAVAAGMLSPEDALTLVITRSKLIDSLPNASMLVIGADLNKVLDSLALAFDKEKTWLDIAAVNSSTQTVVAGPTELVLQFRLYCENNDLNTHLLNTSHAYHSRLLDPILKEYESTAEKINYKESNPDCTFISAVDGKVVSTVNPNYWVRHTRDKVKYVDACHTAVREGQKLFLEIGPHPVLSALMTTNVDDIADIRTMPSLRRKVDEWDTMLSSLATLHKSNHPINWENFHRFTGGEKIDIPGYHFEEVPYWMNIKEEGSTPFHPLIGGYVPNASGMTIFKNSINVNRLPFLKDHSLGDKIIFPCVGYVDMCMTAAYAATHCQEGQYTKPTLPMCVRNFAILTPICLSEMQPTEFQVVVNKSQEGDTVSTIYTKVYLDDGTYKWVKNAVANFNTSPPPSPPTDILNLESIKKRCHKRFRSRTFDYKELEDFGFNFGPSCQTVHNAHINPEDEGEWLFTFTCHESQEDLDRFTIHPWVTDPMLQSQIIALGLLHDDQVRKRLVVPVQIDNFTWHGHSSNAGYIYMKNTASSNACYLLDMEGKLMVSMVDTTFMDTTLSNILSLIDSQKNPYPSMAEYVWREKLGPQERRIPEEELASISLTELLKTESGNKTPPTQEEEKCMENLNKLASLYFLKAMKELGLDKETTFTWPDVVGRLGVVPRMEMFLRQILLELKDESWFTTKKENENVFKLMKAMPALPTIQKDVDVTKIKIQQTGIAKADLEAIVQAGENLAQTLTGHVASLPIPETYFRESLLAKKRFDCAIDSTLLTKLSQIGSKTVVRILEVGGGTGGLTSHLVSLMVKLGVVHFDYTFTDKDKTNVVKAEVLFEGSGISVQLSPLDLDEDPLVQGYGPGHYDLIVGSLVLSHTSNLTTGLHNLRKLLRPGGYLFLTEFTNPRKASKLLFGVDESIWKFNDKDIRQWEWDISSNQWNQLLRSNGFSKPITTPLLSGECTVFLSKLEEGHPTLRRKDKRETWIVFGEDEPVTECLLKKLEKTNFNVQLIKRKDFVPSHEGVGEEKMREILRSVVGAHEDKASLTKGIAYLWGLDHSLTPKQVCEPFLYVCKLLSRVQRNLRVICFTRGNMCTGPSDFYQAPPTSAPLIGMVNVLANENQDLYCKCVDIDNNPGASPEQTVSEGFTELFANDADVMVAFRNKQRCTPRVKPYKVKAAHLPIPQSPRWKLALPPSYLIQDLKFVPCEPESCPKEHVEIEVKAYGLNFLDTFMVTKPDPVFMNYNYLGVDIAGIVTSVGLGCTRKIGDRVVATRNHGVAMPSHLISHEAVTALIPDNVTYFEGATFPMGILTVVTCLIDVAKVTKDDTVLIHTASGGVGLIGIQICKRIGCRVVVTAGNERKRNYLRGLGLKYVFNSRSTDFQYEIRKALGGKGVTIVLNSLTSPGFKEATLALCEEGARFVEMSKMNIWSKEEVRRLRPDVKYDIVDVSTLSHEKYAEISLIIQEMLLAKIEGTNEYVHTALPLVLFDASEIREALLFMEKVKHIGKIVVAMPEHGRGGSGGEPYFPIFTPNSSYLITGGMGGIGLEVANWMSSFGAKTIVLLGRSAPKPDALDKIEKLRSCGMNVVIRQADVSDMGQLKALMKEFKNEDLPPLRGVMHASGLLDDATFENQNWEKYENTFKCKVEGAWNLHQLSLNFKFSLEHFVLFSSLTATVGAVGQSNYVAANQYLDALAHYRYSLGLPGTVIDWGQWGGVGMAANLVLNLHKPFTVHQGMAALQHTLKSHKTHVIAHESDLAGHKHLLPSTAGLFADIEEDAGSSGPSELDGDEFWREYDAGEGRAEKFEVVRKFLKRLIRLTLKMDKNENVEDHTNFQDMGMDSLMMVEMKNGLQASVGKRVKISINAVKDCKTVVQLTDRLVELISGIEELPPPTFDELLTLVKKDSQLGDDVVNVDPVLRTALKPLGQATIALVTGATGSVGPYVLREIFKRPQIKKVYCLMQPNPLISPLERFRKVYEKKGLFKDIQYDKVECIIGDVKEPRFGLTDELYNKLASEVEIVFNLAVKSVFEEIYRETEDPKSCRVINVYGMRNVLSFAADKKLKYIFHASTFAAEMRLGDEGCLYEGWPVEEEISMFPSTTSAAYSVSKLICDRLAEQAVEKGIPLKAFRLPQLGGDVEAGTNVPLESFLIMRFLGMMYIGSMHSVHVPLTLMAVNEAAKLAVDLFFNEETGYEMYNVINPYTADERDFEGLAKEFGVSLKVMEPNEFLDKFKEKNDSEDDMLQLVKYTLSKHSEMLRLKELPYYTPWRNGNRNIFWSKKMEKFVPNYPNCITPSWEVLRMDLRHAKETGIFDRFSIKHSNPYLIN